MINTRKNDEGCAISPRLRHLKPTARVLLLVHYFPICSCRFTRGEYGCGHQQPAPSTIRLSALRSSPSRSGISPNTSPGLTMFKGFLSRPTRIAGGPSGPAAGNSTTTSPRSPVRAVVLPRSLAFCHAVAHHLLGDGRHSARTRAVARVGTPPGHIWASERDPTGEHVGRDATTCTRLIASRYPRRGGY